MTFLGFMGTNITISHQDVSVGRSFFWGWDMTRTYDSLKNRRMKHQLWDSSSSGKDKDDKDLHPCGWPLVNCYITMEHHHFQWVDPRTKSPFSYVDIVNRYLVGNVWWYNNGEYLVILVIIWLMMVNNNLVGGWAYPSEKNTFFCQLGLLFPIEWKNKKRSKPPTSFG